IEPQGFHNSDYRVKGNGTDWRPLPIGLSTLTSNGRPGCTSFFSFRFVPKIELTVPSPCGCPVKNVSVRTVSLPFAWTITWALPLTNPAPVSCSEGLPSGPGVYDIVVTVG